MAIAFRNTSLQSLFLINLLYIFNLRHITKRDVTKERRSYMAICEGGYYNKVTRICGEKHVVKRNYHTFEKAHNFILEGACVVLMRYIGLLRYKGNIKTDTVVMNGTICESVYVSFITKYHYDLCSSHSSLKSLTVFKTIL